MIPPYSASALLVEKHIIFVQKTYNIPDVPRTIQSAESQLLSFFPNLDEKALNLPVLDIWTYESSEETL